MSDIELKTAADEQGTVRIDQRLPGSALKLVRPVIRPATREDLQKFYRGKYPFSCNAIVGLVRGRRVAVGGIGFVGGMAVAFCDLKPSARPYKISIVKAAAAIIAEAKTRCRFIWAEADPAEPMAVRWITSMGFLPTNKPRIYLWSRE